MEEKMLKRNRKIIVVIIMLILIGGIVALAETLINSKNVVYEDNSNLMADNVQDAIDNTCANIDKRLSEIEDKLYTVSNFSVSKSLETAPLTLSYTGLSIDLPANSYCSVTGRLGYNVHPPIKVALNRSPTSHIDVLAYNYPVDGTNATNTSVTANIHTDKAMTVYLWGIYREANLQLPETVFIDGFCATKYER